ncbi:MAG: hypothetical protein WAO98_10370 [Alphaproteobacteria bacterium]
MAMIISQSCFQKKCGAVFVCALLITAHPAQADITVGSSSSSRVLREALASRSAHSIYQGKNDGLNVSGGLFSGRASGVDPSIPNYLKDGTSTFSRDRTAEMEGDQRVYALMLDSKYSFKSDLGTGLPIKPYMSGGIGMAMWERSSTPSLSSLNMKGGAMVPLARVGAGVNYQMSEAWDMSLDYKAGFSMGGDPAITSNSAQRVNLHTVNIGMHYQF